LENHEGKYFLRIFHVSKSTVDGRAMVVSWPKFSCGLASDLGDHHELNRPGFVGDFDVPGVSRRRSGGIAVVTRAGS